MWPDILTGAITGLVTTASLSAALWWHVQRITDHALGISMLKREAVGRSELEFRKQQLAELYGPLYSFLKTHRDILTYWTEGKLPGIDAGLRRVIKERSDALVQLLSTKAHLIEGAKMPDGFIQLMTNVTIWGLYVTETESHSVPESVTRLERYRFPLDFEKELFKTTEKLKAAHRSAS